MQSGSSSLHGCCFQRTVRHSHDSRSCPDRMTVHSQFWLARSRALVLTYSDRSAPLELQDSDGKARNFPGSERHSPNASGSDSMSMLKSELHCLWKGLEVADLLAQQSHFREALSSRLESCGKALNFKMYCSPAMLTNYYSALNNRSTMLAIHSSQLTQFVRNPNQPPS